jgi:soluble lytic murein transglycosylase-like protein
VGCVSASCWVEAGIRHSVEPELLYAIAQVESGLKPRAVNHNSDGSRDIGLMQINSMHLPRLQARGITEQRLLDEPCTSITVGASILAEFIERYGYNWTAVGAYNTGHSPRQAQRLRYAGKVWRHYRALLVGDLSMPVEN